MSLDRSFAKIQLAADELDWLSLQNQIQDIRLTRAFYLVRHQDDARVARINRMAEVVVDWMREALQRGAAA